MTTAMDSQAVRFVGIDGVRRPVRWLVDDPAIRIAIFHGSDRQLPAIVRAGIVDERTFLYFTFAWYQNGFIFKEIGENVKRLSTECGIPDLHRRVVLFVNSKLEWVIAKSIVPELEIRVVSNNAFLRPDFYRIDASAEKKYDAVMVARATAFKRHWLAKRVGNVAYVANDWKGGEGDFATVDIASLSPAAHFKNLKRDQVCDVLNSSRVGLILSQFEGACYAAVEYLLCGLPVVSTPSFGGRDEFFDDYVSVICPAQEHDVEFSVEALKARLRRGEIQAEEIRERAIRRIDAFRAVAADSFQEKVDYLKSHAPAGEIALQKIREDHKLLDTMNFFVQSAVREEAQ